MEELGNSFAGESTDLISLVSKDIADPAMKVSLNNIESVGKGQYELFIKERLRERSKLIDDGILRKNLPLWKPGSKSSTSKEKMKLKSVKTDCQLFGSYTSDVKVKMMISMISFLMKIKGLLLHYRTVGESGQNW